MRSLFFFTRSMVFSVKQLVLLCKALIRKTVSATYEHLYPYKKTTEPIFRHNHAKKHKKNRQMINIQSLGDFFSVDTWTRTKDPHHVKVIL